MLYYLVLIEENTLKYSYNILDENQLTFIIPSGRYSLKDIKSLITLVVSDPDYNPDYNVLLNLREVNYTPVVSKIIEISEFIVTMKQSFRAKTAIITKSELMYQMFKLSAHYTSKQGLQTNIFKDMDIAKEWLGEK